MAYERTEYPKLSWSKCREDMFNECLQKYLFHYYTSHNGWEEDASEESRVAYRLKNIESIHITFGSAMHQLIKKCILLIKEKKQVLDLQDLINEVRNQLNEAYRNSKNRAVWEKSPKKIKMLHEMYYEGQLDEEDKKIIRDKILTCATNFFNSKTFKEMVNNEGVEFLEIDEEGFDNYIMLGDNKVFAKIDLLYKSNEKIILVDWKTGKPSEEDIYQAEIYAFYIKEKYGIDSENLEIRMEYLLGNEAINVQINSEQAEFTRSRIEQSQNLMKQYLEDVNINKPLPAIAFAQNTNENRCKKCNYRQICDLEFV